MNATEITDPMVTITREEYIRLLVIEQISLLNKETPGHLADKAIWGATSEQQVTESIQRALGVTLDSEGAVIAVCGDYPAPCNCDDPITHGGH